MLPTIVSAVLTLLAPKAYAAQLATGQFGIEQSAGTLTISIIVSNVLSVAQDTIVPVCTAIFIAGAFFFTVSAGDEQRKSLGKDLMIGALIGIAVVVGVRQILNMAYFFLYGSN
ncbi:hypothetical protein COU78_00850 [Candidatus Peregrinibacteria bacterium CG10_big_fil_rev_8_21_14_0_10_49_24]|nr:MAG: hypothetical protein COV83_01100 [Candidatus Peregrinibacteria bacterium CG11_big_fil_rev_8_21_14_0_20_49_14]PIR51500.1 MAG: hypothetical protein COU78_00850 [Candidatus Peregrinibacteria bacterium CG10_big_fil_rev_8_21_14_0_10_49_24]PJA67857.1 MAG: hypothetical protein CO157_02490 [Candidatus Peregrinibacteria bacterium CG_4_9_14_3_um_filter_49_12]